VIDQLIFILTFLAALGCGLVAGAFTIQPQTRFSNSEVFSDLQIQITNAYFKCVCLLDQVASK
jgi:uncharacterized membrane protein